MNTVITTQTVSLDMDVNTAIKVARLKNQAAEAAILAPLPADQVNSHVKREIEAVIGKVSPYEVRYLNGGIIDAHEFISEDGNVIQVADRAWDLYGVVVPGLEMKKGYKLFVRTLVDMNSKVPTMPFVYFAVLPAMWRRVLGLPNSRAYYGVSGWLMGFRRQNWANGVSHVSCMNSVADLERFCK